jgi:hypothetical protein
MHLQHKQGTKFCLAKDNPDHLIGNRDRIAQVILSPRYPGYYKRDKETKPAKGKFRILWEMISILRAVIQCVFDFKWQSPI